MELQGPHKSCDISLLQWEEGNFHWLSDSKELNSKNPIFQKVVWTPEFTPLWWIPDVFNVGLGYCFSADMVPSQGPNERFMGVAQVDPQAIFLSLPVKKALIHDEPFRCCIEPTAIAISQNDNHFMISRIHSGVEEDVTPLYDFQEHYPSYLIEKGKTKEANGEKWQKAYPGGVLLSYMQIHLLWLDADKNPRGWEKIDSLEHARQPHWVCVDKELLLCGNQTQEFVAPINLENSVQDILKNIYYPHVGNF